MRLTIADLYLLPRHDVLALLRARLELAPDAASARLAAAGGDVRRALSER